MAMVTSVAPTLAPMLGSAVQPGAAGGAVCRAVWSGRAHRRGNLVLAETLPPNGRRA